MGRYEDFIASIRDERPLNCKFDNSEQHHIIPRCIGGSDDADNLIYLTYQEHFTAHRFLAEDNADNFSLVSAFWRMCNCGKDCDATAYAQGRALFVQRLKQDYQGEGNPFYGKHVTEEHAAKMREGLSRALRGRVISPEHRQHLSESLQGKMKGVPKSDQMRQNLSCALMGHTVSQTTRDKIAAAQRGVPKGPYSKRYYHCTCAECNLPFVGTSSSSKYCEACKQIKNQ